jgi:hypothetical protein
MIDSHADATSSAVENRSSRDFVRHRSTIPESAGDISGFSAERSEGWSFKTASSVSCVLVTAKGRRPASIS